jgi:hypothetical protein
MPDNPRWWLYRLGMKCVPTTTVNLRDYKRCLAMKSGVFTDASLEAARLEFKDFPNPTALRKFLINWETEHDPPRTHKDPRHRSLLLTDEDRQRLRAAVVGCRVPNGPVKRLTQLHVRIAHDLASWQDGQPSHEKLARAVGANVRTVRRALPALRAIGLLPQGRRGLMRIEMPRHVHGFKQVMEAIAAHAGCSVKTLYRWEQDWRETLGKPRHMDWCPKGRRARRMRTD